MGRGNQGSPWTLIVTAFGVLGVVVGILAALPHLPGAVGAFLQHLQNPTPETLVTSVKYVVAIVVAFAVPTTLIGILIAAVGGLDV